MKNFFQNVKYFSSHYPTIKTTHGLVKGLYRKTIYNDDYFSFEKIPYAQQPIGSLRFKAPCPVQSWSGVLECYELDLKPLQIDTFTQKVEGNEDCLYLNVYVKKLRSEHSLPVMVFIYGGSFKIGDATRENYSPDYFMMKDIVLITLNYRLGPLGFLSLKDPNLEIPGNAGLKDQLMALKWIKANCCNFNGDPNNITVFGESAGSASIHLLMLSKKAKELFHKAILMSGTAHNTWALRSFDNYAYRLAQATGYQGIEKDHFVLNHIQAVSTEKLISANICSKEDFLNDNSPIWGPIIEPYENDDSLITEKSLASPSWGNNIPVIIGGTSFEGLLELSSIKKRPYKIETLKKRPELIIPSNIRQKFNKDSQKKISQQLIDVYFQGKELNINSILCYLRLLSYSRYWLGFQRTALHRLCNASNVSTYLYRFDFDSPTFNHYRIKYCGRQIRGVAHADDLSYLFHNREACLLPKDNPEFITIQRMISMWTSFAQTSNPNCKEIHPLTWSSINAKAPFKVLNISTVLELMNESPEAKELKMWLRLYENETYIRDYIDKIP